MSGATAGGEPTPRNAAFRDLTGQIFRYKGKRARVMALLANSPAGITQLDTLPWNTRLAGTIHAFCNAGLVIDSLREGGRGHTRYRLATPGSLLSGQVNGEAVT